MVEKKEKTYTENQKKFLDVLYTDEVAGNIRKAMDLAGYSKETSPGVVIAALAEELIDISKKVVASHSIEAAFAQNNVMKDPNQLGAANKLKAAQSILDRAGIVHERESSDVKLNVPSGGFFILPAKDIVQEETEESNE